MIPFFGCMSHGSAARLGIPWLSGETEYESTGWRWLQLTRSAWPESYDYSFPL